jgi:bifunctional DNase/RNase
MAQQVELEIKTIVPAHSHGAYTLVLGEINGERKLPVLIGAFEAQAIAMELEGMKPSRPLTHDLFAQALSEFQVVLKEVCISKLEEGIYYSTLYLQSGDRLSTLDSRTSDAIALATKFKSPIFVEESILKEAGYSDDSQGPEAEEELVFDESDLDIPETDDQWSEFDLEELDQQLNEAIQEEDYARAAQIRDELTRRNKQS